MFSKSTLPNKMSAWLMTALGLAFTKKTKYQTKKSFGTTR